MGPNLKWTRIIHILGVIALIGGIIDPLEGSVVIAAGALLIVISAFFEHQRNRFVLLLATVLIITGVVVMFYVSSLGGYNPAGGGWLNLAILPYPVGWIIMTSVLIGKALLKYKKK